MLRHRLAPALSLACLTLVGCAGTAPTGPRPTPETAALDKSPLPQHQLDSPWFTDARQRVRARPEEAGGARNVIFFLGDGMGISTVTAARILAGQQLGGPGEDHSLSFDNFPVTGLAHTYNVNSQTADSAGTMSALMTGVKTDIGVFGVDERVERGDCASVRGAGLLSLLDIAELAGKRTGVISTARLTHATPAATYAYTPDRDWEDDSEMPAAAIAAGCRDIATQFVEHRDHLNRQFGAGASDGIEVAMGGGRRHFLPADEGGRREDGANLVAAWQGAYPGGFYAADKDSLAAAQATPLLGLFADSHMAYELQRRDPSSTEPGLVAMTEKAIDLLDDGNGFLLVVEAGRIDHAHHAGNAANALNETVELSDAVAAAMARVDLDETLIIVTADHGHTFVIAGYPRRGNPILGKVVPAWSDEPMVDVNGLPYTTVGYMNGRGFRDFGDEPNADTTYALDPTPGRVDLSDTDTTAPGFHQEALIPLGSETHGGEDVPVYATGPGAATATGSYEQNLLFHVMLEATGWERAAAERLADPAR
jgi:alkaline phosphatase